MMAIRMMMNKKKFHRTKTAGIPVVYLDRVKKKKKSPIPRGLINLTFLLCDTSTSQGRIDPIPQGLINITSLLYDISNFSELNRPNISRSHEPNVSAQ